MLSHKTLVHKISLGHSSNSLNVIKISIKIFKIIQELLLHFYILVIF